MVDINDSRSYDPDTFEALISEQMGSGSFGPPVGIARAIFEVNAAQKARDETTDPIAFLKQHYPGQEIFRFILTHPDLDHMRGLDRLLREIRVRNFWDTKNTKPEPDFRDDEDKEDWCAYMNIRAGAYDKVTYLRYTQGDQLFAFARNKDGSPGGDNIEIMSPTAELINESNARGDWNNLSIVIRIRHVGKTILLPGDAEDRAWDGMRIAYGANLKSDILKASHHGRDSGFNLAAMKLINPIAAIVSVGRKPDTDASHKYRYHCSGEQVFSTRHYGNITISVADDGKITWLGERNNE